MRSFAAIMNLLSVSVHGFTRNRSNFHSSNYLSQRADRNTKTCNRVVSTTNHACSYTSMPLGARRNQKQRNVLFSSFSMLPDLEPAYTLIDGTSHVLVSTTNQKMFEAEVFGDLSHICLDFLTFFSPETIILRLVVLCGRVCSIVADISLDNAITIDEAIFQSIMIFIAFTNFAEKLIPLIRTRVTRRASFRDKRIYQSIFKQTGMGYLDFLALLSDAFQWIELSEGAIAIEDADNILLTYHGVVIEHKAHESISSENSDIVMYYGGAGRSFELIGNLNRAAKLIDDKMYNSENGLELCKEREHDRQLVSPLTFLEAKTRGTLLLRLNMKRLTKITEKDSKMRESIKTLLLLHLQRKLSKYVAVRD